MAYLDNNARTRKSVAETPDKLPPYIRFLKRLRPGGRWLLTAIEPDGPLVTRLCTTTADIESFVGKWNDKRNLYYHVNPAKDGHAERAKKEDIARIEYLHADLDPRAGETPKAAKQRYLAAIKAYGRKPTRAVDTGNGIQALWRLKTPVGTDRMEDVEARSLQLTLDLGGTAGTQNIDRLLRLPGTWNLPNAAKRKKGRARCRAKYLPSCCDPSAAYELDDFKPATASTKTADETAKDYPSRSEEALAKGRRMANAGCSPDDMRMVLREHPHIVDQGSNAERAIERIIEKVFEGGDDDVVPCWASSFEYKDQEWLWWPFFPLGELTTLYGNGDVGKTTLTLTLAGHITRGDDWPRFEGDDPAAWRAPKGSVLWFMGEGSRSTLRGILEAAGADLNRFAVMANKRNDPQDFDPYVNLQHKVERIEARICEIGDVRLVVIDPMTDFLNGANVNSTPDMRKWMQPLKRLAERHKLAVVLIHHMNKKADLSARYRAGGADAIINAPRSAIMLGLDPNDENRRVLVQVKSNLARKGNGVAFTLEPYGKIHSGITRVVWESKRESMTADELSAGDSNQARAERQAERAEELLKSLLADGRKPWDDIQAEAKERGISRSTIKRAKKKLGIEAKHDGKRNKWFWKLPMGGKETK